MIYEVKLCYENIEAGGSTQFVSTYNIEANSYSDACKKGEEKLGCNLDGKLFWINAKRVYVD